MTNYRGSTDETARACIERGLLKVASDVMETARGSLDRPAEMQRKDVAILKDAIATWRPGLPCDAAWDGLVRLACEMAIGAHEVAVVKAARHAIARQAKLLEEGEPSDDAGN